MNTNKMIVSALLLILLFLSIENTCLAMNTGFEIQNITEKEKEQFIEYIELTKISQEPERKGFSCFDVSKDGLIAIGIHGMLVQQVCVYSEDFTFLYGYKINLMSDIMLEWDNENLNIFIEKGGKIFSVNPNGEIQEVLKTKSTSSNNNYFLKLQQNQRTVNKKTYTILPLMNLGTYSCLTVTNENGETSVLYDARNFLTIKTLIIFAISIVFVISVVIISIVSFKKNKFRF